MPICPHITRWSFIVKLILQFRWKLKRDLLSTILNWRYGMFVSFSYIINNPITFQKRFIAICSIISCKYDHLQYQTFEARERDVSITIFQNCVFIILFGSMWRIAGITCVQFALFSFLSPPFVTICACIFRFPRRQSCSFSHFSSFEANSTSFDFGNFLVTVESWVSWSVVPFWQQARY